MAKTDPEQIRLTREQASSLQKRIKNKLITDEDVTFILSVIQFHHWMQDNLSKAKLTIRKLRRFFMFQSETRNKNNNITENNNLTTNDPNNSKKAENPPLEKPPNNPDNQEVSNNNSKTSTEGKQPKWDQMKTMAVIQLAIIQDALL